MKLISIILIGIALSMDTFSLSLSVGMFDIDRKKCLKLAIIVGIMHFIMPILGTIIGSNIIKILEINSEIILGILLILIAIQMFIDCFKKEEANFKFNTLGMFLFALGVSIDSFSVGLGLNINVYNIYLASSVFSICSFLFTWGGLIIGNYANKILGVYANIIGIAILFILGIVHLI